MIFSSLKLQVNEKRADSATLKTLSADGRSICRQPARPAFFLSARRPPFSSAGRTKRSLRFLSGPFAGGLRRFVARRRQRRSSEGSYQLVRASWSIRRRIARRASFRFDGGDGCRRPLARRTSRAMTRFLRFQKAVFSPILANSSRSHD